MRNVIGILALVWAGIGNAQETVNGSPVVMGTLTASAAQAGQNLYLCTATAVWSPGTGGSGGGSPGGLSSGLRTNNVSGGFAGQPGLYSTLYNGGVESQQAENCFKGIVMLYLHLSAANTNPGNLTSLTAGSLAVRVCGVTLQ